MNTPVTMTGRAASRASRCVLFALLAILLLSTRPAIGQPGIPAFPGAAGHGSRTPGGRGGAVIEVTNLNASGPGSLRAALEARGPRIVVFRVGGTIKQTAIIEVREPFLTIAGQTAPGDGITIRGPGLAIMTHDVIVRGLRIRVGDDDGVDHGNADAIRVDAASNVIVDRCSLSWGSDENLSTSTYSGATRDVTFQYNIVSEALRNSKHPEGSHSMGLLVSERSERISIHHNLLAHNEQRNAQVKGGVQLEMVNNIIYDWGTVATDLIDPEGYGPPSVNLIGNTYKPGPSTVGKATVKNREGGKLFASGNVGVEDSGQPVAPTSDLSPQSASQAYEQVLASAGATAPRRDAIDVRIVADVRAGSGRIIDSPSDVGGWLNLAGGTPPADRDKDGMPDAWETARGLNPNDPNDRNNRSPAGYTMVEEYINGLFGSSAPPRPAELPVRAYIPLVVQR